VPTDRLTWEPGNKFPGAVLWVWRTRVHEGKRRVRDAERMMALITAQPLVQHLERRGFVVMNKAPPPAHTVSAIMPPGSPSD
jgi:hypothetical protein